MKGLGYTKTISMQCAKCCRSFTPISSSLIWMASLARSLSTRVAKRLEKPKPLKSVLPTRHSFSDKELLHHSGSDLVLDTKLADTPINSAEDVLVLCDIVSSCLLAKDYTNILPLTNNLVNRLKNYGSSLEEHHEEKLNKMFEILRTSSHDINLDRQSRMNLLQLIELRAAQWQPPSGFTSFYSSRSCHSNEANEVFGETSFDIQLLGPGDVLKSSGKYRSPTRVPGKNYCKDEVVIRNSDSGKVNPGAKERLVQITGPTEDKITYAKNLIEDTIKRNASPVREEGVGIGAREVTGSNSSLNSSVSDESNRLISSSGRSTLPSSSEKDSAEFKYSVYVMNDIIHISSSNLHLLNEAFNLLDSSYSAPGETTNGSHPVQRVPESPLPVRNVEAPNDFYPFDDRNLSESDKSSEEFETSTLSLNGSGYLRQYSRRFLLDCSTTKPAIMTPLNWDKISETYPNIVKQPPKFFDLAAYQKRWSETDGKTIASLPVNIDDFIDSD